MRPELPQSRSDWESAINITRPTHASMDCVQEVRWKRASVRFVEGRRARYKLFWIGNSTGYGGVGIFIAEKWIDKVIDVKRVNDRIIVVIKYCS